MLFKWFEYTTVVGEVCTIMIVWPFKCLDNFIEICTCGPIIILIKYHRKSQYHHHRRQQRTCEWFNKSFLRIFGLSGIQFPLFIISERHSTELSLVGRRNLNRKHILSPLWCIYFCFFINARFQQMIIYEYFVYSRKKETRQFNRFGNLIETNLFFTIVGWCVMRQPDSQ